MYKVIIADDEPIMRKAMDSLVDWKALDCKIVYIAANGQEVIEYLRHDMADILLTDIRMPGVDGIELTKYINENNLPIQVIILTAYSDFSYAQVALKFQVVDYVVKTGGFEEIVNAIERAKAHIRQEERLDNLTNRKATIENFLKSMIDGSLYDEEEILEREASLQIKLENYLVLLFHFRLDQDVSYAQKTKIYKSLLNFFSMVFGDDIVEGIFVKRDVLVLVLNEMEELYQPNIQDKCMQTVDMMDNFMNLTVFIGVSARAGSVLNLKEAYYQAEAVLDHSFLDQSSKINYYIPGTRESYAHYGEMEAENEKLCMEIAQGNVNEALAQFDRILKLQKEYRYSGSLIKGTGITIRGRCRKLLAEFEKDLYDITEFKHSISNRINSCLHVEEYRRVMEEIIQKTAACIQVNTDKRHCLVYDCEQYIDAHYMECISVSDIAESIGTSASYLSRIFKEATGNTIIYTMNQKKVDKAKEYLKDTDMKIYEIADALGFENTTYFSHFFKKHTGISPKDFR